MFVSAVIPAFNEERTIACIIKTIRQVNEVNEIIVVSDGSTDRTAYVSGGSGARVIELPNNRGKGAAVKAGMDACRGDIVLLLDADLIGLKPAHITLLLEPVMMDAFDMTIGVFSRGRFTTDLAQYITPQLSGQRVVRKELIARMFIEEEVDGYGLEIALTRYSSRINARVKEVALEDLTHIMKEEKLGLVRGFAQRIKMYWHIVKGLMPAKR